MVCELVCEGVRVWVFVELDVGVLSMPMRARVTEAVFKVTAPFKPRPAQNTVASVSIKI